MKKTIIFLLMLTSIIQGSETPLQKTKKELRKERKEKYTWQIRQHCFDLNKRAPHQDQELFSTLMILFETVDQVVDKATKIQSIDEKTTQNKRSIILQSKSYQLKQLITLVLLSFYFESDGCTTRSMPQEEIEMLPQTIAFLEAIIQSLLEEDRINQQSDEI